MFSLLLTTKLSLDATSGAQPLPSGLGKGLTCPQTERYLRWLDNSHWDEVCSPYRLGNIQGGYLSSAATPLNLGVFVPGHWEAPGPKQFA